MSRTKSKKTTERDAFLSNLGSYLANSAGGGTGGNVYMGMGNILPRTGQQPEYLTEAAQRQLGNREIYMSQAEALAQYDEWSTKKQDDFLAKLKVAGLVQSDAGPMEAYARWENLVAEAARKTANGHNVSPFDILGSYISQAGGMKKGAWQKDSSGRWEVNVVTGERRYIGPQFTTTTDTRVDTTDPATARALATKMFQDLMGRDPGKGELAQFGTALSQAEAASPQVATTQTEYATSGAQAGEVVGTNTVTSGGVSAAGKEQIAEEQVKKKPEYGATQSATTYMNALENAVYGAPG